MLVLGVYRVLAWVVSVMLPPMAIFFPLFTLLEDLGYLPRVAFNLDKYFKKCCACGKQGPYHVYGIGMQRSRYYWVQNYRLTTGAIDRHNHQ
jgi:Fe2+ transport system protein B